jgi:hypothetical protein
VWRRRVWVGRERLERLKLGTLDQLGWVELELRERGRVLLAPRGTKLSVVQLSSV